MNRRESTTGTIPATAAGGAATAFGDERPSGQANAQNTAAAPDNGAPRFSKMRTIGLEEHWIGPGFFATPGGQVIRPSEDPLVQAASAPLQERLQDLYATDSQTRDFGAGRLALMNAMMLDLGAGRLALMDEAGIDVQVLSHGEPEYLEASDQVSMVRDLNDYLRDMVARHPTRFAGFASLCTAAPGDAARELERMMQAGFKGAAINGHSRGRYLDDKFFWPMLEAAEHLDAPIYLHPTQPPKAVFDTYYSGFSPLISTLFSINGCGWHIETGIHVTRMILGGVFDQFPNLKVIIGHMGEGLSFWLPRMDANIGPNLTRLKQPISAYLRQNVYYTFSAFNFLPSFINLVSQVGIEDRIMFSTDHPWGSMLEARTFLDALPISHADRERIAHGNAERLLKM